MPPKHFKTSDSDFTIFRQAVIYWISFFGLKSWEISIQHNDRHLENRATCEAALGPRHATITLTKSKWPYKIESPELRLLAFHEVIELILTPISEFAEARHPSGDLNDLRHEIIHTLENSVWRLIEVENGKKEDNK